MKEAHLATIHGKNLPISTKVSIEICSFIRNRNLQKAKLVLESVLKKKRAVPYKRHNTHVAHKPGKIAAGRYPQKAAREILNLLNGAEANAEHKGLDSKKLMISMIKANQGSKIWRPGRIARRVFKRTNIDIEVKEEENDRKTIPKKKD